MLFAEYQRYQYARSPLIEVICQLRFPTILTINSGEPADFQEAIRQEFPRYAARKEQLPPKVVGAGGPNAKVEPQSPITNHSFISADGLWKINLTKDFIALSTLRYTNWEDFALRLDKPLAQFIQVYQPAFFQRVGLRYLNAISKKRLGLPTCCGTTSSAPPTWASWGSPTWMRRRWAAPPWRPSSPWRTERG